MRINQIGRSMVEMLGVLAIIGVLSVGAIAGYSKAMMKYKLNQHAQSVNLLLNNLLQMKDTLPKPEEGTTLSYNDILNKLKLLPDGIKYVSETSLIDKYFNIRMYAYHNRVNGQDFGGLGFYFGTKADYMADVCRNIVFAAKENSANLDDLVTLRSKGGTNEYTDRFYGDNFCNGSTKKCLSKITLKDTDTLCVGCVDDNSCSLYVMWK